MLLFERQIATRYALPGLARGLTGILSLISLLGLTLSVFGLILVMSVMNGFERELQDRMLALTPHAKLTLTTDSLAQLEDLSSSLLEHPDIERATPFIDGRVILRKGDRLVPVQLGSIDPQEILVDDQLRNSMRAGSPELILEQRFGVLLGSQLAMSLGVYVGDTVIATLPRIQISPMGTVLRERKLDVLGVFEVGAELDSRLALMNLRDAARLLASPTPAAGLKINTLDRYRVETIVAEAADRLGLSLSPEEEGGLGLQTWREENAALYAAVVMEKLMIFLLLLAIVAVASFSIVAIVLMSVLDKQTQIAILRTYGATKLQIKRAFLLQGLIIGVLGTAVGVGLAVLIAPRLGELLRFFEGAMGWQLFDPDVYYIAYLPTVFEWSDVAVVSFIAISISLLVSIFPASRAADVDPVIALSAVH